MTKGEAKELMLRWLDEATVNGEPTAHDQIADYLDRADHLLDGVVKFLAGQFKISAVYSIVRSPIKNLLDSRFSVMPVVPPDTFTRTAPCQSYYLEVCGDCTITFSAGGEVVTTRDVSCADSFMKIKGNVPPGTSDDVTVSIESEYPFVVRNVALYPCRFIDDDAVSDYVPYVPYELPENYREFDKIIQTNDCRSYSKFDDFRKEGLKTYLLPYYAAGQFEFHYYRNPNAIPADAPDDTVIEIPEHAAQLVPLKLAVDCCMGVNELQSAGYYLDNRFNGMLVNLLVEDRGDKLTIEPVYSMV